jgi:predicted Zn-dependent protease
MQRKIYLFLKAFCLFTIYSNSISAQNQSDTLSWARDLSKKGQFEAAVQLLVPFVKTHPNDVNAPWVLGQNYLWMGQLPLAKKFYKKAVALNPDNDYLCIDYARALLEMGEAQECVKTLVAFERKGKIYSDAKYLKAKAFYWQGDYVRALKAMVWLGLIAFFDSQKGSKWANFVAFGLCVQLCGFKGKCF